MKNRNISKITRQIEKRRSLVINALSGRAKVYQLLGLGMQGITDCKRAEKLSSKHFGPDHVSTLAITSDIGHILSACLSRFQDAIQLYNKVLKRLDRQKHPALYADVLNRLGLVYWEKADYTTALRYHEKAMGV